MLGVRPMLGRAFESSDAGTRAVLLSHRTWLRKYGGNPAVLDSLIQTPDRPPLHIVGIPPPRFRNPLLAGVDGLALLEGKFGGAPLLARLKPGVTPSAAVAQLNALRGEDLAPGVSGFRLVPLREEMSGQQGSVLWLLLAASAIVLGVACVNLANLILPAGVRASAPDCVDRRGVSDRAHPVPCGPAHRSPRPSTSLGAP